jgi:hypothetical protein
MGLRNRMNEKARAHEERHNEVSGYWTGALLRKQELFRLFNG